MRTSENMLRFPVASGDYMISGRQNIIINAYLGTCVGLTLCDREADIGGLIHLLLPEPTSSDMIFGKPENYALTGLPVFLKALCNEGAKMERLEATIAGGALIGPLTEMDLNLDIGGRTVEIVESMLSQWRIPVLMSETGGFFSYRLSLDLMTWQSSIEPFSIATAVEEADFEKPDSVQLDNVIESVHSIPQIVLKIIRMIRDDSRSLQDLAGEIRRDQVITAKVMRLCNSAFFHQKMNVDSIDRALVLLGEKQLLQLVVSAVFKDFFSQKIQGYSLCKGGLFNHALGTALLSEQLAVLTGKVSADIAYTAGLIHDIGKVVLDQYMGKAHPFLYRRTLVNGETLLTVEREAFGITHNEVGSRLAVRWSLPEAFIDVIQNHHDPENSTIDSVLTYIVYLADLLMSRFLVGQELDRLNTEHLGSRLQKIGLSYKQLPFIIDNIPRQIFSLPAQSTDFEM